MEDSLNIVLNTLKTEIDSLNIVSKTLNDFIISSKDNSSDITVWISLLIAFFAVLTGPIVQLIIGKKQIESQFAVSHKQISADIISKNKQLWISEINNLVSEIIVNLKNVCYYKKLLAKFSILPQTKSHEENISIFTQKSDICMHKLILLLDPEISQQKELIQHLNELFNESMDGCKNIDEYSRLIITLTQKIILEETKLIESNI
ncbi:MAG: hypothetical protein KKF62_17985 [Bacteroidetes bacterium]|nr:hypothetical protein [Bacteroidota bacterium]MBU1115321.1 hypothetical protein [Bacteroidota bacterium]MBU1800359.1 hypothetical protein [Bacteroidota bacterium]